MTFALRKGQVYIANPNYSGITSIHGLPFNKDYALTILGVYGNGEHYEYSQAVSLNSVTSAFDDTEWLRQAVVVDKRLILQE